MGVNLDGVAGHHIATIAEATSLGIERACQRAARRSFVKSRHGHPIPRYWSTNPFVYRIVRTYNREFSRDVMRMQ